MTDKETDTPSDEADEILLEMHDDIAVVTFNRPVSRNALTMSMYSRLAEICAQPPELARILVVRGAGGKAFAAGTDITQFREFSTARHARDYEATMETVLSTIENCPLPTIAVMQGACTGGGAMIAAVCDLRIATPDLRFGFPIARTLGNCLSAANLNRLAALLGAGRVREIIFTSRTIGSEEAKAIGLVRDIVDPEKIFHRAMELAQKVAAHAPLTLRATRELQNRLASNPVEDGDWIVRCYTSEDFRNGLESFLSKQHYKWRGK